RPRARGPAAAGRRLHRLGREPGHPRGNRAPGRSLPVRPRRRAAEHRRLVPARRPRAAAGRRARGAAAVAPGRSGPLAGPARGRGPTTPVYVALGAEAWPDGPAGRRVDLTAEGLDATMFAAPTAATGDWFVALGGRAASRLAGSSTDGTPEQAARLARVLEVLASASSDIAVVAVAG